MVSMYQVQIPHTTTSNTFSKVIRIATFNIAHGRGTNTLNISRKQSRESRLNAIAALLKKELIDVAVLQEVDFDAVWSGHQNQSAHIAEVSGFKYVLEQRNFDMAVPFLRLKWGNAVISKYPISNGQDVELPVKSRFESTLFGAKRASTADIKLSDKTTIRICVVHLDPRDEAIRLQSAPTIMDQANKSPFPFFCVGDFNSSPSTFPGSTTDSNGVSLMDMLAKSNRFHTRPTEYQSTNQLTWPAHAPTELDDWILVPTSWKILNYKTIETDLSDHRAVIMDVEIPD